MRNVFLALIEDLDVGELLEKYYYIIAAIILAIIFTAIKKRGKRSSNNDSGEQINVKSVKNLKSVENVKSVGKADDLKHIETKYLTEKVEMYKGYYRYQEDKQVVIKRSDEQQKIFDEYFVVKNLRTITCNPQYRKNSDIFKVLGILSLILGAILLVLGVLGKKNLLIIGIVLLVFALVSLILKYYFLKKFNESISQKDAPKKLMTDEEYEKLVSEKIEKMDIVNLGINKLGLDPTQIEEIKPIILKDKTLINTSLHVYNEKNRSLHSSTQYVTLLFFTDVELFVYKIQFDMCCDMQEEWTSEYFYRDICDVSTYTKRNILSIGKDMKIEYSTLTFRIISNNSSIGFDIDGDNENIVSVQAMKQKIRDKKNF